MRVPETGSLVFRASAFTADTYVPLFFGYELCELETHVRVVRALSAVGER